jgi:hypothetical protein
MKYIALISLLLVLGIMVIIPSCKKEPVTGCTDPLGDNYNASAEVSDNSCTYQKRFIGEYAGQIACKGYFKSAFTMANLSINELIKKDEVNIIISSTIGPLPVLGKISKDTVFVDQLLTGLKINLKDLFPIPTDQQVDADGRIKTKLGISPDNKKISGLLEISLIPKTTIDILGFPIPAGTPISDKCDFVGTKK